MPNAKFTQIKYAFRPPEAVLLSPKAGLNRLLSLAIIDRPPGIKAGIAKNVARASTDILDKRSVSTRGCQTDSMPDYLNCRPDITRCYHLLSAPWGCLLIRTLSSLGMRWSSNPSGNGANDGLQALPRGLANRGTLCANESKTRTASSSGSPFPLSWCPAGEYSPSNLSMH
jgi:hypothetical protein